MSPEEQVECEFNLSLLSCVEPGWHPNAVAFWILIMSSRLTNRVESSEWLLFDRHHMLTSVCRCQSNIQSRDVVEEKAVSPWRCCSPPARWGLLDFIRVVLLLLPPPPSPPPRPPPLVPPLPPLPRPLLPCQLLAKLFANFLGTFPAQCAPLDLNLGPS